jgi:hypothetical protein
MSVAYYHLEVTKKTKPDFPKKHGFLCGLISKSFLRESGYSGMIIEATMQIHLLNSLALGLPPLTQQKNKNTKNKSGCHQGWKPLLLPYQKHQRKTDYS